MLRVFDLDGVLLDTRSANLAAYQAVGIDPPDGWFHQPWQAWCPANVHRAKVLAFPEYVHLIKGLPLLHEVWGRHSAMVVTSASTETLGVMHEYFRIFDHLRICGTAITLHDRLSLLRQWGSGVYYDDSADTCREVQRIGGWQTCHVQSPYSCPPQATDPDSEARSLIKEYRSLSSVFL